MVYCSILKLCGQKWSFGNVIDGNVIDGPNLFLTVFVSPCHLKYKAMMPIVFFLPNHDILSPYPEFFKYINLIQ